jgi:hypothetical protein
LRFGEEVYSLAVVSLFSAPDKEVLRDSCGTVKACKYQGQACVQTFDARCIKSVIAMVPAYKVTLPEGEIITPPDEYFVVEKPYMEQTACFGLEEWEDGEEE